MRENSQLDVRNKSRATYIGGAHTAGEIGSRACRSRGPPGLMSSLNSVQKQSDLDVAPTFPPLFALLSRPHTPPPIRNLDGRAQTSFQGVALSFRLPDSSAAAAENPTSAANERPANESAPLATAQTSNVCHLTRGGAALPRFRQRVNPHQFE